MGEDFLAVFYSVAESLWIVFLPDPTGGFAFAILIALVVIAVLGLISFVMRTFFG